MSLSPTAHTPFFLYTAVAGVHDHHLDLRGVRADIRRGECQQHLHSLVYSYGSVERTRSFRP